jgi:outer membrane lipoprotein SlyB
MPHGPSRSCRIVRYMATQHNVLDNAVGIGIAYGAGIGMVLGIAIAGAPGIALGAAFGAGLGVLAGLGTRSAFTDARR